MKRRPVVRLLTGLALIAAIAIALGVGDGVGPLPDPTAQAQPPPTEVFSVAPNAFGCDPADILALPGVGPPACPPLGAGGPSLSLPCAAMGLVGCGGADDIDALSAPQPVGSPQSILFSVAPGAVGCAGTAVAAAGGAPGAEYFGPSGAAGAPCAPGASGNGLVGAAGAFGLPPAGDMDASDWGPAPPGAFLISLAPGSPTLGAIGATPADLLATPGGGPPPIIALPAVALGLVPGAGPPASDDIDGVCGFPGPGASSTVLFSLAPGSPTLAAIGASPSDVLWTVVPPPPGAAPPPPPAIFKRGGSPVQALGMAPGDDLDAMKCQEMTIPVMGIGGIAELPAGADAEQQASPQDATSESGRGTLLLAGILAAVVVVSLTAGGALVYARSRRFR